jgi:hypothetical protein
MNNCCQAVPVSGLSSSDIFALIAIFISLLSLIFTYLSIYLSKHLEIRYQEFERLCLLNTELIIGGIDEVFSKNEHDVAKIHREKITNTLVELQLFMVNLKISKYDRIDLNRIIKIIENFTDNIYNGDDLEILNFKGAYYSLKIEIYAALYEYAVKKELRWHFIVRKFNTLNIFNKLRRRHAK